MNIEKELEAIKAAHAELGKKIEELESRANASDKIELSPGDVIEFFNEAVMVTNDMKAVQLHGGRGPGLLNSRIEFWTAAVNRPNSDYRVTGTFHNLFKRR